MVDYNKSIIPHAPTTRKILPPPDDPAPAAPVDPSAAALPAIPEEESAPVRSVSEAPTGTGENPSYSVILPSDAGCKLRSINSSSYKNGVTWKIRGGDYLQTSDTFLEGVEYTVYINLETKKVSEKFSTSGVTVTVNGITAAGNLRSGYLEVYYTFDPVEPLEEYSFPENFLVGDVNADGATSVADYNLAKAHMKGNTLLEGYMLSCADVAGNDGKITVTDVNLIRSHFKGSSLLY